MNLLINSALNMQWNMSLEYHINVTISFANLLPL